MVVLDSFGFVCLSIRILLSFYIIYVCSSFILICFIFSSSVLMLFSLYWTMKFFQSLIDFIVGGCVLWHFTRDSESGSSSGSSPSSSDRAFDPNSRVILHIHCALTSSLGTICKGLWV